MPSSNFGLPQDLRFGQHTTQRRIEFPLRFRNQRRVLGEVLGNQK